MNLRRTTSCLVWSRFDKDCRNFHSIYIISVSFVCMYVGSLYLSFWVYHGKMDNHQIRFGVCSYWFSRWTKKWVLYILIFIQVFIYFVYIYLSSQLAVYIIYFFHAWIGFGACNCLGMRKDMIGLHVRAQGKKRFKIYISMVEEIIIIFIQKAC